MTRVEQTSVGAITMHRLGKQQRAGIEIYVTDPAHWEPEHLIVGEMYDSREGILRVPAGSEEMVADLLTDAANSADAHGPGGQPDRAICRALTALVVRVRKAGGAK